MSSGGETSGFRLTHTGLRVSNLDNSIRFYTGVFGMQELGRISMETTTIVFLGFVSSVAPGTGLFAREGVLELTCGTKKPSGETGKLADYADTRFVKLCFSVPDVSEAVSRMERHNVKFVQKDKELVGSREIAKFLGAEDPEKGFDAQFWEMSKAVPFVEDPDGYLIEVLPNNAALP